MSYRLMVDSVTGLLVKLALIPGLFFRGVIIIFVLKSVEISENCAIFFMRTVT